MKYNIISFFAWALGLIIGTLFFYYNPIIVNSDFEYISITNLKDELTFLNIFSNNTKVVFINVIGGLTFGLLTFLNLVYNGIVFSYILKMIYAIDTKYYINLIPHSIEILSFILAGAIGFKIGILLFNYIFHEQTNTINYKNLFSKLTIAVMIVFVSALLEVYISPYL